MSEMNDNDSLDLNLTKSFDPTAQYQFLNSNFQGRNLNNNLTMNDLSAMDKRTSVDNNDIDNLPSRPNPTSILRQSSSNLRTGASISESAAKKRVEKEITQQIDSLQKQLDNVENKNMELTKIRKKLTQDLDQKTREVKFLEKQCYEQQNEISQLKTQLDSTLRVTKNGKGLASSSATTPQLQQHQQQLPKLMDEIKHLQDLLTSNTKENTLLKEKNSDLQMKIKILQDALTFRSEEIGLSGHSDLLLKVSALKGEVVALKKELTTKITSLDNIEEEKKTLVQDKKSLQEQISLIQDRLAKSQQETHKLTNNDLGLLLKTTEQERDLLLDYIQQNMNKTLSLTKQIEMLENENKIFSQKVFLLEKTENEMKESNHHQKNLLSSLEVENQELKDENRSLSSQLNEFSYEIENLQKQLNRKLIETEENEKVQATLFSQLRAKDEELLRKSEEIIHLKTKLQEFDTSTPLLQQELTNLRNKLQSIEKENSHLSSIVHELEPKVAYLEPFSQQLQKELNELEKKKKILENEHYQFKSSHELLMNLQNDLNEFDEKGTNNNNNGGPSSPLKSAMKGSNSVGFTFSPSKSPARLNNNNNNNNNNNTNSANNNDPTDPANYLTLSQQHSLWISLPSIRNLHPKLYEKLRQLSQDLYKKEIDYTNLQMNYNKLSNDHEMIIKDLQEQLSLLLLQNNHEKTNASNYSSQLKELEKSLIHYKELVNILSQFRTIFKSYPLTNTNNNNKQNSHENNHDDNPQLDNIHHVLEASSSKEHGKLIDELKDYNLPEYLQQLLLQLTQISYAYHETMQSLELLTNENHQQLQIIHQLKQEKELLENECHSTRENYFSKENFYNSQEKQYFSSIEQATELTEKQNALLMTLEAKIESLHRDKQIQKAQIHSLQQREDTLKQRLLTDIEKDFASTSSTSSLLTDLQQLLHQHRNNLSIYDLFHFLLDKLYYYVHYQPTAAGKLGNTSTSGYDRDREYGRDRNSGGGGINRDRENDSMPRRSDSPPLTSNNNSRLPYRSSREDPTPSSSSHLPPAPPAASASSLHPPRTLLSSTSNLTSHRRPVSTGPRARDPSNPLIASSSSNLLLGTTNNNNTMSSTAATNPALNPLQERLRKAQAAFAAMKDNNNNNNL